MRYVINPPDLPEHFYGYGAALSICHTLNCKKGGLILARHNEIRDGVTDLSSKDFAPKHMRDDPKLLTGCTVHGRKAKTEVKGAPRKNEGELKRGILIRDIWMQLTDIIHGMRVVNTNGVSHQYKPPEKCLDTS